MTTSLERPLNAILSTTEYTIFKKRKCNRPLNEEHIDRLAEAISKKNMLAEHPIFVNEDMEVLDGQNRLKAAEMLNIPIFYIITKNITDEDIILLNTARKNWNIANYCDFYISKGNKNYTQIKYYSETYEVPINVLLNCGIGTRCSGDRYRYFKEGYYKFPEGNELKRMEECLNAKVRIIEELLELAIPSDTKRVVRGDSFCRAILSFLTIDNVIPGVLQDKLRIGAEKIRACASQHGYHTMLKEIYNWKNKNPID